jgi:PKHD-type hydroxylase|tara:strand:- start:375 stop:956 length:582 start_codon:yes stop_codon:yes gene_type:complete
MNLKNLYWSWNNAVGNKFCNDVIKFASTLKKRQAFTIDPKLGPVARDEWRKSKIIWLNENWIYKELLKYISLANKNAGYNFVLKEAEPIQYTRYDSDNYYHWHIDQTLESNKSDSRKMSICINLTDPDEFEGGDFWVSKPHVVADKTEKIRLDFMRKRGSAVVFPSFVFHRVAPVTKGTRHSLVCWVRGPLWT